MIKKILVFAHEHSMNGASHSLFSILKQLSDDFDFYVIVPQEGLFTKNLQSIGINYSILEIPRIGSFNKLGNREFVMKLLRLKKIMNDQVKQVIDTIGNFKPEIIYTNTSVLNIGYYVAKKLEIPHIWHIREYGDLDFQIHYFPSLSFTKKLMHKSSTVIFTTNLLKNHWYGKMGANSKVVHNGFDKVDNALNIRSLDKVSINIGIVGYLLKSKGQLEAINILNKLKKEKQKVNLFLYGEYNEDSEYYKEIIKTINENNLAQNIIFCGYRKQDEIYNNIDFLLNCSDYEAFGRTIIEAMSYGIPVISKNTGGPQEIITHAEDGFLYNDIAEAVTYLKQCIDNKSRYSSISLNAQKKIKEQFSVESYINNMKEIFSHA